MLGKSIPAAPLRNEFFQLFQTKGIQKALQEYTSEKLSFPQRTKKILLNVWNTSWNIALAIREQIYKIIDYFYTIFHPSPKVISIQDTLKVILETHCSVSRFGDGELKFIAGSETWFQKKKEHYKKD